MLLILFIEKFFRKKAQFIERISLTEKHALLLMICALYHSEIFIGLESLRELSPFPPAVLIQSFGAACGIRGRLLPDVLKNNVRKNQSIHWSIVFDLLAIGLCAYAIYLSVDYLVQWVTTAKSPYFNLANLGWLSGVIMVVPNAFLALYYAHTNRQDIVVSSQVGDGHICIPMCIGLFALVENIAVPSFFQWGVWIILGAGALHFLSIAIWGRLPRIVGFLLLGGYGLFMYKGLAAL